MKVVGQAQDRVLADVGFALGRVKHMRGLTADDMRIVFGLKGDDQVPKYLAGTAEMGFVAWLRANEAWPELAELLAETSAERALKMRQRPLDLEIPPKRRKAAA